MKVLEKFNWYANRLSSMSPPEVLHRIHETARKRQDKNKPERFTPAPRDLGPVPPIPNLREGLAAMSAPQELTREWEEQLAQAKSGHFFLLGQLWPNCAPEKKWHLDPVTATFWPSDRYCFSINFRHTQDKGDVKYVWELNRLQYLQPIAALSFLRKDATLGAYCIQEIESWIDSNPPLMGVAWASGIELALRVVSIFVVMTLVGDGASEQARAKIWATLETHARWLHRYPSRFSSANNHATAEGLALFLIGALCPMLEGAGTWKEEGVKLLCDTARNQILEDGVGAEQTPNYTAVVLEMLLLGQQVARATGTELPGYYAEKLAGGGEYLRWFTDAGGNQPRIGDDDNARVLGAYRRDERYVTSVLAAIAAVTNRADLTPPGVSPHLRQAIFGIPPDAASPPAGVRIFDTGGYTVARHNNVLLALDHGPLGYLAIAAHGHADALALWLHIGSQPVLVDAGTYLYHSGGQWRRHFRSTRAHNTLSIEGADSSSMSGAFNWSRKARAKLTLSEIHGDDWWVEAEHDGYRRKFGVIHRRRVSMKPAQGFTVVDRLSADGSKHVEIAFLVHPDLTLGQGPDGIVIKQDTQSLLRLYHEGPLITKIINPGEPDCGWYSPTFGEKQAAPRIVFTGMLAPEEKAITRFMFMPGTSELK